MNRDTTNRYNMALAVQKYLDGQSAIWSSSAVFTQEKNKLDALIIETEENREEARVRSQGLTQEKNELKREIAVRASRYSAILQAYARINGHPQLADKTGNSMSHYEDLRDVDFPTAIQELTSLLNEHVENLVDYQITEAQITELETSNDDFRQMIGEPRLIRSERSSARIEAEEAVDEAVELMNNRMDLLMSMFDVDYPEFVRGYKNARTIVDN